MAPLTRSRAGAGDIPGPLNAASAGLIISEATNISQQGKGYAFTPGIYTRAQIAGWKGVTDAVHSQGGLIFCQLWHVGRISHPSLQPHGGLPVAPSAIRPNQQAFTETGLQPCVEPRALRTDEIPGIVEQYRHAAKCAKEAGFDGVEIHSANGYLLHQFLADTTNLRTDAYGGSIENRVRLPLEVVAAVSEVWGGSRVGIRIAPVSPSNDVIDSAPLKVFGHLLQKLNPYGLAYLHVVEGATGGKRDQDPYFNFHEFRRMYQGVYVANNGYDLNLALQARENNWADLICFGKLFISNPDLVKRFRTNAPLSSYDPTTFYGGGAKGYTDYPALS
ncbi:unnamed protein product [Sphagnum tenellum]